MAIKKGNVRLQVTVGEEVMRDLDELCQLYGGWSRSRTVAYAIWSALIDARLEKVEENKERREKEGEKN